MKTIKNLTADELRKSILQLAIQGKLVKQNPDDEPASELVKRIYEEKNKLIAEGKIKKDKNQSYIFKGDDNCYYEKIGNNEPVKLDDLPFDIPDNWMWIKFGDLVYIQTGASFKKEQAVLEYKNDYIRVLRGGNILPFKYLFKNDDLFLKKGLVENKILLKKYDLITPAVTSLENIGKVAVINEDYNNVTAGGFVYIFRPYITLQNISNIIMNFMSSSLFQSLMKAITKKSGQAFYNMNKEKLKELYFPLPPLEEQQRIVDKINSFEPLLEKYDRIEKKLSKLEKEFPEKLQKSILQYAIEGKLVKQDPNDEPASVLLERIKQEKERLIKEGKIKRDKNETYIYQGDDKNYYENIPQNWVGTALSKVISLTSGTDLKPEEYSPTDIGVPYLTGASNIDSDNNILINRYTNIKYINSHVNEILLTCKGTIGKIVINNIGDVHVARQFMSIKSFIDTDYLLIFLNTLVNELNREAKSMIPGIDREQVLSKIIDLPPLMEQKRIANKVNIILNQILN